MRAHLRAVALAAFLTATTPVAAQQTGAPASTMTTNSEKAAPPPRYRPARDLRETEAEHLLRLTPRPPLNIDCTPAQKRAAQSDLEQAQYRLKCGG